MLNLNPEVLQAIADKAIEQAAAYPRWIAAIGRALVELDQNPWIERGELHGLVIGSPSGKLYSANGTCQCKASEYGQPCWHRAAARLVRLHDEAMERTQIEGAAIADAQQAGLLTMPEGDTLDTAGMRVARKIAAARATQQLNELFA